MNLLRIATSIGQQSCAIPSTLFCENMSIKGIVRGRYLIQINMNPEFAWITMNSGDFSVFLWERCNFVSISSNFLWWFNLNLTFWTRFLLTTLTRRLDGKHFCTGSYRSILLSCSCTTFYIFRIFLLHGLSPNE